MFENTLTERAYGVLIAGLMLLALLKNKIRINSLSVIMLLILFVMIASRASITYLLFYSALFVIVSIGVKEDFIVTLSCLINFFSCIQIIGMLICWMLPGIYVNIFLPVFSGIDYYSRLYDSVISGASNIGFTCQNAHFAGFMVLGMANRFILYRDNKPYLKQRTFIFLFLSIIGLYLSGKRAHFGFCLIALLIAYYFSVYLSQGKASRLKRFLGMSLLGCSIFLCLWIISFFVEGTLINQLFDTLSSLGDSDVDVTTGRVEFWRIALQKFRDEPVLGIGWKQFYKLKFYGKNYDVHNIYLQLLCETGLVGAIVFFILFAIVFAKTLSYLKKKTTDTYKKKIALFALFYQIFFLLYGVTGNPLYDASYYIFYFVCVAFITAVPAVKRNGDFQ